jgi:hypothetical protein
MFLLLVRVFLSRCRSTQNGLTDRFELMVSINCMHFFARVPAQPAPQFAGNPELASAEMKLRLRESVEANWRQGLNPATPALPRERTEKPVFCEQAGRRFCGVRPSASNSFRNSRKSFNPMEPSFAFRRRPKDFRKASLTWTYLSLVRSLIAPLRVSIH